ncbi:MAG: dipeptide epimerase [Rhodothermales bacterium]|nr:dipeptide epimerase [Rhodothermales bacterium]MBO6780688.1 dipeptide epimerase [Rhodothermales bacterium]
MVVSNVDLIRAELPFHAPFRISLTESAGTVNLFVRLTSDTGMVGLGEASPSPAITGDTVESMTAAARTLAPVILGRPAHDVRGADAAMTEAVPGQTTLRSAFDMAMHDLAAQQAGMPLYAWFGGRRESFPTDNTVSLDSPGVMADTARRFLEQGFRAIKIKVGTAVDEDVARIRAVREAIGPDVPLRVDANQAWSAPQALEVLTATLECDVEYFEQPVPRHDVPGLATLKKHNLVPIMADESVFDHRDALALVKADAADLLNIKLSKSGGLVTAGRIAAVAHAAGLPCMLGCMSETRLGLTAAAHFISAHRIVRFADLDSHVDHITDPVVGGMRIEDGLVQLPDSPGIGATLDPDFVASCPTETLAS